MFALNIRNLSPATHQALRLRAAKHGRSIEAEIRAILDEAVRPHAPVKLGSLLAASGHDFGGIDLHIARAPSPAEPALFE